MRGAGKKSMSLYLPLNVLEADVTESSKTTLYAIRNISAKYPLSGIRSSVFKNTMTLFMSEVLYRVLKEGSAEQGLFEWCEKNILLLDALESSFSNFHLRFLLELTVVLGFSPSSSDIRNFVGEHYAVVDKFITSSFAESMLIPLSGVERNEIAGEMLKYIEYHTESIIEVNSLKVLRELFV